VLRLSGVKCHLYGLIERSDDRHDRICIIIAKHPIQPIPMKIGKWRLIEQAWVHHSLLSQEIDNLLDKADLVGTELVVL